MVGYGTGFLKWVGHVKRRETLRETMARGIPLDNPVVATAWGLARRGKAEAASTVLRAYGLSSQYLVRRRTLVCIAKPGT